MTAKTQCDRILEILQTDGQIDNFRAIHERISLRLGARIHDLRGRGYEIETKELPDKNTVYRLVQKSKPVPTFLGFVRYVKDRGIGAGISDRRSAELYQDYLKTVA